MISTSLSDTNTFAKDLLTKTSHVIGLYGDLGSGKTALTKAIAKNLGITEEITSPTFVIAKFYTLTDQKWHKLIHIDAYRLHNGGEIAQLGFLEWAKDPNILIVVEWPEHIKEVMPEHTRVECRFVNETEREYTLG